jgi:hypothetical protein
LMVSASAKREHKHESTQSNPCNNHHCHLGRFRVRAKRTITGKSVWRRNKRDGALAHRPIDGGRDREHEGHSFSRNERQAWNNGFRR